MRKLLLTIGCIGLSACNAVPPVPSEPEAVDTQSSSSVSSVSSLSSYSTSLSAKVESSIASSSSEAEPVADLHEILVDALHNEYRSHARYQAAVDAFGDVSPFPHVDEAQEQRIAKLQDLFRTYELPIAKNPYLGQTVAPSEIIQACRKGKEGERETAAFYEKLLPLVEHEPDVHAAFANFAEASLSSHVPLFERCIDREMKDE